MPSEGVTVITSFFEDMPGPRVDRTKLHPLLRGPPGLVK